MRVGDPSPPLLVAIESATESASVALLRPDAAPAERAVPRPASEHLLPALLALLDEAGVAPGEVAAWAVSIGPGSFTGLRVGVATVKGLAFDGTAPVAAVPTLAALAERAAGAGASGPVAAVLDARRGEVYAAGHAPGDPLAAPLFGPAVMTPAELAAALRAHAGPWTVAGEGVAVVRRALAEAAPGTRLLGPPAGAPAAAAVGRLGLRLLAAGRGVAAEVLVPHYVRRAEAEVRRTGQRFEAAPGAGCRFDTPRKLS